MGLTILNVAYPFAPVSPDAVGGSEQVVSMLERSVAAHGHRSLVIACEGSRTVGELTGVPLPVGLLTPGARAEAQTTYRRAIEDLLRREAVDVVHYHGVDFHSYAPDESPPALVTLHLPLSWYPPEVYRERRNRYLHCVSHAQRATCPSPGLLLDDIPNGVDLAQFAPCGEKADYALVLGRICPEKGVHLALDAATRAGVQLVIAGRVFPYPEHERYFDTEVRPRLGELHRFVGPIAMPERARLLARARCLVVASTVEETSSLVSMEALASGTPVVALRRGALPDVVTEAVTGFLADSVDELAQGIRRAHAISPARCRAEAESRFSAAKTCERYLDVYRKLAARTHATPPEGATIDVLRSVPELERIEGEWRALWPRCQDATVFQRPEWQLGWAAHLLTGEPFVLALRRGARLVGLVPLFLRRSGGERVLSLMGAGVSDYQCALFEDSSEAACLASLEAWLERHGSLWTRMELTELRLGCPLSRLHVNGASARALPAREVCPGLPLTGAVRDIEHALPHVQLHRVLYARRHAARDLGLSFEDARFDNKDELFAALVRLHGERWRARGSSGALASDSLLSFHRDVTSRLLASGNLLLKAVRLGGALAAVLYGFFDRDATRYYLSGFDSRFERYSPGLLAIAQAIEGAIARGDRVFDFLRGAEPYKYAWGARDLCEVGGWVVEVTPPTASQGG